MAGFQTSCQLSSLILLEGLKAFSQMSSQLPLEFQPVYQTCLSMVIDQKHFILEVLLVWKTHLPDQILQNRKHFKSLEALLVLSQTDLNFKACSPLVCLL